MKSFLISVFVLLFISDALVVAQPKCYADNIISDGKERDWWLILKLKGFSDKYLYYDSEMAEKNEENFKQGDFLRTSQSALGKTMQAIHEDKDGKLSYLAYNDQLGSPKNYKYTSTMNQKEVHEKYRPDKTFGESAHEKGFIAWHKNEDPSSGTGIWIQHSMPQWPVLDITNKESKSFNPPMKITDEKKFKEAILLSKAALNTAYLGWRPGFFGSNLLAGSPKTIADFDESIFSEKEEKEFLGTVELDKAELSKLTEEVKKKYGDLRRKQNKPIRKDPTGAEEEWEGMYKKGESVVLATAKAVGIEYKGRDSAVFRDSNPWAKQVDGYRPTQHIFCSTIENISPLVEALPKFSEKNGMVPYIHHGIDEDLLEKLAKPRKSINKPIEEISGLATKKELGLFVGIKGDDDKEYSWKPKDPNYDMWTWISRECENGQTGLCLPEKTALLVTTWPYFKTPVLNTERCINIPVMGYNAEDRYKKSLSVQWGYNGLRTEHSKWAIVSQDLQQELPIDLEETLPWNICFSGANRRQKHNEKGRGLKTSVMICFKNMALRKALFKLIIQGAEKLAPGVPSSGGFYHQFEKNTKEREKIWVIQKPKEIIPGTMNTESRAVLRHRRSGHLKCDPRTCEDATKENWPHREIVYRRYVAEVTKEAEIKGWRYVPLAGYKPLVDPSGRMKNTNMKENSKDEED